MTSIVLNSHVRRVRDQTVAICGVIHIRTYWSTFTLESTYCALDFFRWYLKSVSISCLEIWTWKLNVVDYLFHSFVWRSTFNRFLHLWLHIIHAVKFFFYLVDVVLRKLMNFLLHLGVKVNNLLNESSTFIDCRWHRCV